MKLNIIILAAGLGKRMFSSLPKVMHKICGKPILEYIVETSLYFKDSNVILVLGNQKEFIENYFNNKNYKLNYAHQKNLIGTADAVKSAMEHLSSNENTIILCGDVPLIKKETIEMLVKKHYENKSDLTVVAMIPDNPFGYGRIIMDERNRIKAIVEHRDCNEDELKVKEVNSGIYCINTQLLKETILLVDNDNDQNEYYLTDMVEIAYEKGKTVDSFIIEDTAEISGINNRKQLSDIENIMLERKREQFMLKGVTFENSSTVYIDDEVLIESDVLVESNVVLKGKTVLKRGSIIKANSYIENSIIGENKCVKPHSVIINEKR